MHLSGWEKNPKKLRQWLEPFVGCQCQIRSPVSQEIYRGAVKAIQFTDIVKKLNITFDWLCVHRSIMDDWGIKQNEWSLVPRLLPRLHSIEFDYDKFYYQSVKERLKLIGVNPQEICRFFKLTDPTTVFVKGEEYAPHPQINKVIAFDLVDSDPLELKNGTH